MNMVEMTIESIKVFTDNLVSMPSPRYWIDGNALYSVENIKELSENMSWLIRAPKTIKEVKDLINNVLPEKIDYFPKKT